MQACVAQRGCDRTRSMYIGPRQRCTGPALVMAGVVNVIHFIGEHRWKDSGAEDSTRTYDGRCMASCGLAACTARHLEISATPPWACGYRSELRSVLRTLLGMRCAQATGWLAGCCPRFEYAAELSFTDIYLLSCRADGIRVLLGSRETPVAGNHPRGLLHNSARPDCEGLHQGASADAA